MARLADDGRREKGNEPASYASNSARRGSLRLLTRVKPTRNHVRGLEGIVFRRTIGQSRRTTLSRELLIFSVPLYSMNPSFLNLFMKKFTRVRVVPTISASTV